MWGEEKVILIMLEILNDGYVDVRVLIYDLKPVFYIRLYISLGIMSQKCFFYVHTVTHKRKIKFLFRSEKPTCKAGIKLARARHKDLGFSKVHYEKKCARPQLS